VLRFVPLASLALALALACAPARPPAPTGADEVAAREILGRFARAVRDGRWEEADALLSARWRHGPGRLALDARGAGPSATEAAARVLAALDAGVALERGRGTARLPVGDGRGAVLVLEPPGWRVDALE
jgi:hypothetical protein